MQAGTTDQIFTLQDSLSHLGRAVSKKRAEFFKLCRGHSAGQIATANNLLISVNSWSLVLKAHSQ